MSAKSDIFENKIKEVSSKLDVFETHRNTLQPKMQSAEIAVSRKCSQPRSRIDTR